MADEEERFDLFGVFWVFPVRARLSAPMMIIMQENTMRVAWPITIVAVLVTLAVCIIGIVMGQVQTVPSGAAPSWGDFIASNALRVLLPALIVGVIAWIIERNIHRSRRVA
jgi:hypothetical protein